MKKIKLFAASAIATVLAIPFAVANKPVTTYAAVEETERVFGKQNEFGAWDKTAYDQFSVDPSAKITKKGYFSANLAGYNATTVGQGLYKVGPKKQTVGTKGYLALELRSDKGGVKLADLDLQLKRRDVDGYIVFNGAEWTDETGAKASELTEEFKTYYLHMPTMFKAKGEEKVDWERIHLLSHAATEGKYLGINYVYYCEKKTDNWGSATSYKIDDFNRTVVDDKTNLPNVFWVYGAGNSNMNGPSYYSVANKTLKLASKEYGNVDGKFSNLSFEAKYGDITKFAPIYLNGEEFVKGAEINWIDLKDENNVSLKKISTIGANSEFIKLNVNLANSGIKATNLAGFEISSASCYLTNMKWTNSVTQDIKVFAQEILDKTGPHCNWQDPEVIKTIGEDWKALSTKWDNMSTTAKDAFLKFKGQGNVTAIAKDMLKKEIDVAPTGPYKYLTGFAVTDKNLDRIEIKATSEKEQSTGLESLRLEFVNSKDGNKTIWNNGNLKGVDGKAISKALKVGENTVVIDLKKSGVDTTDLTHIHVHFSNKAAANNVVFKLTGVKLIRDAKIDPLSCVDEAKARYNDIVTKYLGKYGVTDFLDLVKKPNESQGLVLENTTMIFTITAISIIAVSAITLLVAHKRKATR